MGEPPDRAEAIRVLRRAVEMGVNFIGTADSYRPGVSEEIVAEALHPYPAGLVIARPWSKCAKPPDLAICETRY
jgi:pyridoxine 4-dehydrogenase